MVITDHRNFDYTLLVDQAKLVVDTRNVLRGITSKKSSGSKSRRTSARANARPLPGIVPIATYL